MLLVTMVSLDLTDLYWAIQVGDTCWSIDLASSEVADSEP